MLYSSTSVSRKSIPRLSDKREKPPPHSTVDGTALLALHFAVVAIPVPVRLFAEPCHLKGKVKLAGSTDDDISGGG